MNISPEMRITPQQVTDELDRRQHLRFMKRCWNDGGSPFAVHLQTKMICDRLDKAFDDFKQGKSSYLRISVHQRAGKSEIVSVFLPPRFLATFPDHFVMATAYNSDKANEATGKAQMVVGEDEFKELYPQYHLGRAAAGRWNLERSDGTRTRGDIYSAGLNAGLTGRGFSLGIVDDYAKGRAEAESPRMRERTWNAFTNDFLTRQAPTCIVIVVATWWHEDDVHGRIQKKNDPESPKYDPDFPVFEHLSFPASRDMAPPEIQPLYPGPFLCMPRMSEDYYRGQYAALGPYHAASMMDCNPIPRGGAILDTTKLNFHDQLSDFPEDVRYYRIWDLAHSKQQRTGDDPDYTGGTLLAFRVIGYQPDTENEIYELWIRDYTEFREKAPSRDKEIKNVAKIDGEYVEIVVENSLDAKDAGEYIQDALRGIRNVNVVNMGSIDKVVRCAPVEPIFSAGNVHVLRAHWTKGWLRGISSFDGTGTTHDEMVDNITAGYKHICTATGYETFEDDDDVW